MFSIALYIGYIATSESCINFVNIGKSYYYDMGKVIDTVTTALSAIFCGHCRQELMESKRG
jgi:hypothetical protein